MRKAHALVSRMRDRDGKLLCFKIDGVGGPGNSRYCFVDAQHVPEFEGEQGWFELERVYATPWNFWKPVRYLGTQAPPAGDGFEGYPWLRPKAASE